MSCDDVELTLALAGMGDVDAAELRAARDHASDCARCRSAERDYARMVDMVAHAAVPSAPPPELRQRVLDAVGGRAVAPRRRWARWWDRVPSGRPLTVAGLAGTAAAVALAVVLAVGSRSASPVVNEPLQAGLNQPGVTGTLTYVRGSGDAVLSVRGLRSAPTTPSGAAAVYELWLMRGDGRVSPAGVLGLQADGTWRAVVHRSATAQTAVAATVEPAPGTQQPTGDEVFQSALP